jgi:hypothetical protein
MNTMIKQESNVQLNVTWDEYTYIMHGFKAFIQVLEDKSGQSHEELWKIYRKMYMTRRVEDTWYNKGE